MATRSGEGVGTAVARARPAWLGHLALARPDGMLLLALVPAVLIVGLLVLVVWVSFRESITSTALTWRHYESLLSQGAALAALGNTLGFAVVTLLVSLLFGVPAAWLVERTDLRGKTVVYTAMTIGLLVPGFFTAIGWLFLAHPTIGLLNQAAKGVFGLADGPFNVASIPGMGWVLGLGLASVVFIMTAASLRAMDASLEEAAATSGADFLTTLRRVTLPLVTPAVLAATLYVFTIAISAFDVPAIIGMAYRIYTFSTYLYFRANPQAGELPEYGILAAFATLMIVLALLLSWWYSRVLVQARRYEVVTGKSYQRRQLALGRWAIAAWAFLGGYIVLSKLLPLALLIWAALLPYLQPPSAAALGALTLANFDRLPWPTLLQATGNSLVLMLAAPTAALAFSVILSWVILRTRYRFRLVFDYVAFLPHAVPHIVFAFAAALATLFVVRGPIELYGTLVLLVIVYSLVQLSFGTRVTNSGLVQLHPELEEAAQVAGASRLDVLRRVVVPLLRPALMNAWLWLALLAMRELTIPTMLYTPENMTLSVVVWWQWRAGNMGQASAVCLILLALLLPLIVLYWRVATAGSPSARR